MSKIKTFYASEELSRQLDELSARLQKDEDLQLRLNYRFSKSGRPPMMDNRGLTEADYEYIVGVLGGRPTKDLNAENRQRIVDELMKEHFARISSFIKYACRINSVSRRRYERLGRSGSISTSSVLASLVAMGLSTLLSEENVESKGSKTSDAGKATDKSSKSRARKAIAA